ncbi:hypothetical protein Y032_0009g616 [Ancylostoma ceylanicum]|uniref:Uncharacterized protein n=1 Tax=Ancylostoma ceylanicum TaxID=53326 RepID=A0A016VIK0_9BILA|nr:hypothetical protein Y032_0009g616 [Ancylostoma ceylanicum]
MCLLCLLRTVKKSCRHPRWRGDLPDRLQGRRWRETDVYRRPSFGAIECSEWNQPKAAVAPPTAFLTNNKPVIRRVCCYREVVTVE